MRVEIKRATNIDIRDVIRRSPVAGIPNAENDLKRYLKVSIEAWTGLIDGEVVCVWGLISPTVLSNKGYLWLLTTDLVDKHPFTFVRHSQIIIRDLMKNLEYIEGHVMTNSDRSIRWLKWLGFRMTGERHGEWTRFEMRAA
jgi:hypothetical protein